MIESQISLVDTTGFELGEKEALWIYWNKEMDLLVSDDIKFVRKYDDEADFSTILLLVLLKKGVLAKEELIDRLEKIFEKRGWKRNNLIYIATIAEIRKL